MNEYFGTTMSQQDLQARLAQRRRNNGQRAQSISVLPPGSSNQSPNGNLMGGMMGLRGDSLDDIISQNDMEYRRQSFPRGYSHPEDERRSSIMEFGSGNVNMTLDDFQFGLPPTSQDSTLRRSSVSGLDMGGYQNMGSNMNMSGHQMMYSSPMEQPNSNGLLIDSPADRFPGLSTDMVNDMMGYNQMMMDGISQDDSSMSLYQNPNYSQNFGNGNMDMMSNDFLMPQNISGSTQQINNNGIREDDSNNTMPNLSAMGVPDRPSVQIPTSMNMNTSMGMYSSPTTASKPLPTLSREESTFSLPPSAPATAAPTPAPENPIKPEPNYNGIYSSSGFDMLGILMKVATRKNPEINIGKVDLSCAFVVCDVTMPDCPIVYVSDIFERLTGYSKYEVTGQNCRFLQSPEGKVEAGLRREFVDNDSVYYLKKRIGEKKEAQRSLINYRKGGQPFMNLLTMIPICGDDNSDEIKYFVGFQVDLVEKPTSVEGKNASGLYTVDYSQGQLPRYVWQPPDALANRDGGGQTISRDDVSAVLSSVNNHTESELAKRMWDKVLLENTDDVVHVLSLKGLFLYLSPSCRHVLEYDAAELVGTALSSVCHPSDIVPVTRELKDTSTGASVNVVYRIRRKKSGYTWFESHGALSVEQGKGRKCIILVGRERPVYALARNDVENAGGIGESEIWNKLSTSGMFLFVSSNVRTLLDRSPEDLIGTSIQMLMRPESKIEFGRSLEKARTGKRVTYRHEIMNKRGVGLQAQTTLYPGDAAEGSKPTFLVAQTRLLKNSSRTIAQPGSAHTGSSKSLASFSQNPSLSSTPSMPSQPDNDPPMVSLGIITQAGGGGLAIGTQDLALASEDNIFDELKTTRCTSWQFELRQMEKSNRLLSEELAVLLSNKKKRKRRKGAGPLQRDCANCHTRTTPEWRRGPSGQRDLCNSCGLRWAKQTGRVSPRNSNRNSGDKSPKTTSPLHKEFTNGSLSNTPNLNPNPQEALVDVKGSGGASKPKVLGGRSTVESMPVHEQSVGFRDGGERGITTLVEEGEIS